MFSSSLFVGEQTCLWNQIHLMRAARFLVKIATETEKFRDPFHRNLMSWRRGWILLASIMLGCSIEPSERDNSVVENGELFQLSLF